jgi:PAP2 superfamily
MRADRSVSRTPGGPSWPSARNWLSFVGQLLLVEVLDAGDDIVRGDLLPPSAREAIDNARRVVRFETVHGFFVEPDFYAFCQRAHMVLTVRISPEFVTGLANNVYAFFHIGIPVIVAIWVFVWHRDRFGLLRNVLIVAGLVTLVGYFVFPVAPPRLTTGILFHGRAFVFHNTMSYPRNPVLINGRPLGFNPYAAVPSLHIAWATIIAGCVVILAKNWTARAIALCYPAVMTLAIVATANHYFTDAVGGFVTACAAALIVLVASSLRQLPVRRHNF